jgi:hypothetical protein
MFKNVLDFLQTSFCDKPKKRVTGTSNIGSYLSIAFSRVPERKFVKELNRKVKVEMSLLPPKERISTERGYLF